MVKSLVPYNGVEYLDIYDETTETLHLVLE
jgi:hypothetical protein